MITDDEIDVWARARDGDPEAFGSLFDRHRDRVFGQALRLVRTPHDAEDVTALVFLEAWRKRGSVRVVDSSILPWLLVTTNYVSRNATRAARRHRAAMASLPQAVPTPDHADVVLDAMDAGSRDAIVRQAFIRLPKPDQDVLTLCVVHEFTLQQAADGLGVPLGTVKSRLSRAKKRLADLTKNSFTDAAALAALGDQS
ncbi:RNA polymerase sigma factor [Frondihabitans australicus]|uniref:RNA polymerase sigma-70 factor (ECF subfamily) n=1 Tax=Frondihabitans australicus TaxID=386892 RepID=A0A495IHV0_9MICO|nr:RNA polymerase sigma factor [Frondihabitans australicus]RKR74686.1 RNA polymerase sigma-70 factor (ECF subfamily) [Frondihabitans australicus]